METPPQAPAAPPHPGSHGRHERNDPWYWLRDREDPAVLPYLEAENAYTEEVLAPLDGLRTTLFEEMKARILETDMSVPSRRGPWWYYGRTEEGKNYAIHCRRPAGPPTSSRRPARPGRSEQIMLDENALAEGHDYFAVGTAVSAPTTPGWPMAPTPRETSTTNSASAPSMVERVTRSTTAPRRGGGRRRVRIGLVE